MGCVTVGMMMFQRSSHMPTTTSADAMTVAVTGLDLSHWLTLNRKPKTFRIRSAHRMVYPIDVAESAATGTLMKLGTINKAAKSATAMAEPLAKRGWKTKARCSLVCCLSMGGTTRI